MNNANQKLTNDVLITDALIRIKALEDLLIDKGLILQEELEIKIQNISEVIMLNILQKSNVPGDLNQIIDDLKNK